MTLERHGYGRDWAVPMLGDDQVRLTGARRLPLVRILAVQKDNYIRVLFYTIMYTNSIGDKIMRSKNCRIINCLISDTFDG